MLALAVAAASTCTATPHRCCAVSKRGEATQQLLSLPLVQLALALMLTLPLTLALTLTRMLRRRCGRAG